MWHAILAGSIVGAAALAYPAEGEAQTPFSAGISVGPAIPVSDLAESHKLGYHAAAHLAFNIPVFPLSLRLEGFYNQYGARAKDIVGVNDGGLRILGGSANFVYSFGSTGARLYLIAGAGVYNQSYIQGSITDWGFNGGLGTKFRLAGFGTFAEARFHRISDDDRQFQFVPLTFGIEF